MVPAIRFDMLAINAWIFFQIEDAHGNVSARTCVAEALLAPQKMEKHCIALGENESFGSKAPPNDCYQ
jgi:hypothetical protein